MNVIGRLHFAAALVALVAGAWTLLQRKGTVTHRRIGWVYAASMVALNVSALLIYRLTRTFGPFHVAALVSLGGLVAGLIPVRKRKGNWLEAHYRSMGWSYIGLLAAAVAETATRFPAVQAAAGGPGPLFWTVVVVVSTLVFIVGGCIIQLRLGRTLAPFR